MAEFNDNQFFLYPPFKRPPMWSPNADHVIPVVSPVGMGPKGEQGEQGEKMTYSDLSNDEVNDLRKGIINSVNTSIDAVYTTTDTTTQIQIPIAEYNSDFDMLFIDVNGLDLSEHDDYEIISNTVFLNTPLPSGQDVHFRVLRYLIPDGNKTIENIMGRKDYNTVAEMQADMDLEAGDICHTLGFHTAGDGGGAWYKIKTDGIEDGAGVIGLNNGTVAELQKPNPVNVLLLGFDNTGEQDVSTLFNEYTQQFPLYFPEGTYKIENTVTIVNSVFGASNNRQANDDEFHSVGTTFVSSCEDKVFYLYSDWVAIELVGFNIFCTGNEIAVYVEDNNKNYLKFDHISVFNNAMTAFYFEDVEIEHSWSSRRAMINDITILAKPSTNTTRGFFFGFRSGDIRITNIEIMRCFVGMEFKALLSSPSIYYGGNFHIWCGSGASTLTPEQFADTYGIKNSYCELNFTNVYTDTCHYGVYNVTNGSVTNIVNHVHYGDNSVTEIPSGVWSQPAGCYSQAKRATRMTINGGVYTLNNNTGSARSLATDNNRVTIKDVMLKTVFADINDMSSWRSNYDRIIADSNCIMPYTTKNLLNTEANQYKLFAYLIQNGDNGGGCTIMFARNTGNSPIIVSFDMPQNGENCYVHVLSSTTFNDNMYYWKLEEKGVVGLYVKQANINNGAIMSVKQLISNNQLSLMPFRELAFDDYVMTTDNEGMNVISPL